MCEREVGGESLIACSHYGAVFIELFLFLIIHLCLFYVHRRV